MEGARAHELIKNRRRRRKTGSKKLSEAEKKKVTDTLEEKGKRGEIQQTVLE